MRYLKLLVPAAIAATMTMAFSGAGTASASELCTVHTNPCPSANRITKIEASLSGGTAKFEDTSGNVLDTCTGGTMKITSITGGAGVNPTGTVPTADLTWTGCSFPTTTTTEGTVEAPESAKGGTTIIAKKSEVTIATGVLGSCTYGFGTGLDLGEIINGGNELAINKVVKTTAGGILCPATAVWNATYKVTNHNAVFYIKN